MAVHEADGVFQGGGVKGLALVGALEEFADRERHPDSYVDSWRQLTGTSAGAIVAAYLACGHDAKQTTALIENMPLAEFQDWGPGGKLFGGAVNLARIHGLARGQVFHDWFRNEIDDKTFGDIQSTGRTLKLIATDITRREMLLLPDSLGDYRLSEKARTIEPQGFAIADAVRMSMSIPYFFQPVELVHDETGLTSTIIDGGLLSNFPVWAFDVEDHDPTRPTFGFKLIGGKATGAGLSKVVHALGWAAEMGSDIFNTATDAWDKYWVSRTTYVRTCVIPAGDIGATDFDLSDEQKRWLLNSGRTAARAFLDEWDPGQYVNIHGRRLLTSGDG
jgi:NTE family protein